MVINLFRSTVYFFLSLVYKIINMSKSSTVNLYDALTGDNHFMAKVSSDRMDLCATTVPLNLKGTAVNLYNEGGQYINDVVSTVLRMGGILEEEIGARIQAINGESQARETADAQMFRALEDKITGDVNEVRSSITEQLNLQGEGLTAIQNGLVQEISNIGRLQDNLNQEKQDRLTEVNVEREARSSADEMLSQRITTENQARIDEIKVERERIDALGANIDMNALQQLVDSYSNNSGTDVLQKITELSDLVNRLQEELTTTKEQLSMLLDADQPAPDLPSPSDDKQPVLEGVPLVIGS